MDLVEPLDHALHERRLNSPPDRLRRPLRWILPVISV